jgi:hypothetical protein
LLFEKKAIKTKEIVMKLASQKNLWWEILRKINLHRPFSFETVRLTLIRNVHINKVCAKVVPKSLSITNNEGK